MSNVLRFPTAHAHRSDDQNQRSDAGPGRDSTEPPTAREAERETDPSLRAVIGDVLRDERHDQHRTLADVAEEAAVSLPYLSEVERGRKEVSSDVLAAICTALDLELADVLERSARHLRAGMQRRSGIQMLAA